MYLNYDVLKGEHSMKYIYILLTNTSTLFSRTIKRYTKDSYNHASLALDEDLNELYSFGRKFVRNPLIGGFIKEDIKKGVYKLYPETTCVLYKLPVDKETYCNIKSTLNKFKKRKHFYGYNMIGLLGVIVDKPINIPFFYFCSQFVASVLIENNINLFDKNPGLITPAHFEKCNKLIKIYEGKLRDYKQEENISCFNELIPFVTYNEIQSEISSPLIIATEISE